VAARKVLTPTAHGYEETLQLDRGLGVFEPYYSIPIQRRECAVSAPWPKTVSALASARYICSCLPHCAFETQTQSTWRFTQRAIRRWPEEGQTAAPDEKI